ncbi:hypothetical protein [Pseudovibrio japonicus]|uniref:hypothetical protein n=1 Tax=Pseudovibrio japonicus TaxID=366534 RepID=UPI00167B6CF0|nr:hypothetical protein [Pseudovibrio japonicus]
MNWSFIVKEQLIVVLPELGEDKIEVARAPNMSSSKRLREIRQFKTLLLPFIRAGKIQLNLNF